LGRNGAERPGEIPRRSFLFQIFRAFFDSKTRHKFPQPGKFFPLTGKYCPVESVPRQKTIGPVLPSF
jgi:hypothetical protein